MVPRTQRRSLVAIGAGGLALSLALAGCSAGDSDSTEGGETSLTFLVDNGEATVASWLSTRYVMLTLPSAESEPEPALQPASASDRTRPPAPMATMERRGVRGTMLFTSM